MSSTFGKNIQVTIFGQSHSEAIGAVIDGLPAGFALDMNQIASFMRRRAPGRNALSTPRKESDEVHIVSGVIDGESNSPTNKITCGAPLCAIIENTNTRSADYDALKQVPRPAHADFAAFVKHGGRNDVRGGGHFSARLTAPLCFAGAVCIQFLRARGIEVASHVASIASVSDTPFDAAHVCAEDLRKLLASSHPVLNQNVWPDMEKAILEAKADGDSVGGVIECAVTGLPTGVGEPMFGGVENALSAALFAVPALKGIEFGVGFAAATLRGSVNNDEFYYDGDAVKTRTNNHGGILGGLTSGMPLVFRCAFKPTPSIARTQHSVNLTAHTDTELNIQGRHDPCVVLRAVPCVEAAAAIALFDMIRGTE